MQANRNKAIVVDDKIRPRAWCVQALQACGFEKGNIIESAYGDHAYKSYVALHAAGETVDIVLSDHHMDVRRKPPQGISCRFRDASIFSGIELAKAIFSVNTEQRFCLVSAGLNDAILDEGLATGINLVLYKRRPEDSKFNSYAKLIDQYIDGNIDPDAFESQLPRRLKHLKDEMIKTAIAYNTTLSL